jgi:hypothetical protein
MNPTDIAPSISKSFVSLGIYISLEFITQCLEFIREELRHEYSRKKEQDLREMVYKVFLDQDLHEIGDDTCNDHPLMNVSEIHDKIIKGPFILQIDRVIDISIPTEEQIDLDNTDLVDDEEENEGDEDGTSQFHENMKKYETNTKKKNVGQTGQRMLKLFCTDGINNEVLAVEYKPIPAISLQTLPGTKVCQILIIFLTFM